MKLAWSANGDRLDRAEVWVEANVQQGLVKHSMLNSMRRIRVVDISMWSATIVI